MAPRLPTTIALFDVDGTLTVPRQTAQPDMLAFLQELRKARRTLTDVRSGADATLSGHADLCGGHRGRLRLGQNLRAAGCKQCVA